jgi:hypothetical protein
MVVVLLLLGLEYCSGSFIFIISFILFWLCAFVLSLGYYVVAEAGCNWYLSILIYSLYQKKCFGITRRCVDLLHKRLCTTYN